MTETMGVGKTAFGIITEEPTSKLEVGDGIGFRLIERGTSNALSFPQSVDNWEYFKGSVLAVLLKTRTTQKIVGTAIVIAPGLAVTATHVFINEIKEIREGTVLPYCFGIRDDRLIIWRVNSLSWDAVDDVALVSITAASDLPEDRIYYQFGITTRAPKNGENLHLVGFRQELKETESDRILFRGHLYTSIGIVLGVYPHGIPGRFMPYPLIELSCGSLGGMSGGAAIDEHGLVVGIISRGLETEDGLGPTYVSWVIKTLNRSVNLPWPPGFYPGTVTPMSIDRRLLYIDKPAALTSSTEDTLKYQIWFE